jgi:alkanesulfonate monooxygenase SsuD/methylene tetrahydromethanopterin reductase-like flavin-dependent oxidoreductase (luciferase family)
MKLSFTAPRRCDRRTEIAMLDQMSGGRFELGVGRGISPYELAYHGVDFHRSGKAS